MHATRLAFVILVDLITLKYLTRTEIMKIIVRSPSDNWLQNIVRQVRTACENVTGGLRTRDSCSVQCWRCRGKCSWQRCVLPTGKI